MKKFQYKRRDGTIEDIVEICPDCGSGVKWYHNFDATRMVCRNRCQGYKVIIARGRRDEYFTTGNV